MKIHFYKYHGAGNDFIMIDNREQTYDLSEYQINHLCHRRFGIGADGLMLLEQDDTLDFKMRYYNSDGKEGTMCGNGGRCIVAFAKHLGIDKEKYLFSAIDGVHEAFFEDRMVNLKMTPVENIRQFEDAWFLDTGSPHVVQFVSNIEHFEVSEKGKELRYDERFGSSGSNVNFIEPSGDSLKIRTYERGVEAETYACGTGAVASAIIAHQQFPDKYHFVLEALGGTLEVRFEKKDKQYCNIWLKGPAQFVFEGAIEL